ncbi:MAG: hydrolase [Rhodospirillales bacterium]
MLMDAERALLLAIDFQEKLAPAIDQGPAAVATARRLLEIARLLRVPCLATEQYPAGLGATLPQLAELLPAGATFEKICFSAGKEPPIVEALAASGRTQLVVMGMEAHVCVLQSALVLADLGHEVFVVADAVGSRRAENKALALERMARAGLTLVSAEMVAFEWLGRAATDDFRRALPLLK